MNTRKSKRNSIRKINLKAEPLIIDLTGAPSPVRSKEPVPSPTPKVQKADASCQTDTEVAAPSHQQKTKVTLGDCPICFDELGTNVIVSTNCGHIFCQECLLKALALDRHCPTCRSIINPNLVHALYIGNVQSVY